MEIRVGRTATGEDFTMDFDRGIYPILGVAGSGKTFGAMRIALELLKKNSPVVVFTRHLAEWRPFAVNVVGTAKDINVVFKKEALRYGAVTPFDASKPGSLTIIGMPYDRKLDIVATVMEVLNFLDGLDKESKKIGRPIAVIFDDLWFFSSRENLRKFFSEEVSEEVLRELIGKRLGIVMTFQSGIDPLIARASKMFFISGVARDDAKVIGEVLGVEPEDLVFNAPAGEQVFLVASKEGVEKRDFPFIKFEPPEMKEKS